MSLKKSLLLFLIFFFINCGVPTGDFGWASTRSSDIDLLEKEWKTITDFRMMREGLIFSPKDTIHFVYTFSRNPGTTTDFHISLNRYELDFVEIDIKKKNVDADSNSIRDEFQKLAIGEYLLKIVYEGETIDQVVFQVLPDEGYAQSNLEQELSGTEVDEIVKYSR